MQQNNCSASPQGANSTSLTSHSPQETQAIGKILGAKASPGDVYLLVGRLGAGKTCLAQGILWGMGVKEYARSPTFVLVTQYQGNLPIYHLDLYRLDTVEELADLGLEEYLFGNGVCIVEWAQKAKSIYPEHHLTVTMEYVDETTRALTLNDNDGRYAQTLEAVQLGMDQG